MLRLRREHVALGADLRLQRHHDRLAQRVDGRVGHLRELLPEIVVQRADLVRQHRHRCVIAHRADRFAFVLGQCADDFIALLGRDVEHLLVGGKRLSIHRLGRECRVDQVLLEIADALLQPLLVRIAALEQVIDAARIEDLAAREVEREHFTRPELALLEHLLGLVVPHAGLGCDREMTIIRDNPSGRTQAVAIKRAGGIAAVSQHDTGRAVPRLHVRDVEFVESAQVRVDGVDGLPCRRDQQAHRVHDIKSTHQQHFKHVVERLRVGAVHRDERQHLA